MATSQDYSGESCFIIVTAYNPDTPSWLQILRVYSKVRATGPVGKQRGQFRLGQNHILCQTRWRWCYAWTCTTAKGTGSLVLIDKMTFKSMVLVFRGEIFQILLDLTLYQLAALPNVRIRQKNCISARLSCVI